LQEELDICNAKKLFYISGAFWMKNYNDSPISVSIFVSEEIGSLTYIREVLGSNLGRDIVYPKVEEYCLLGCDAA
jgi:hypothetical protein